MKLSLPNLHARNHHLAPKARFGAGNLGGELGAGLGSFYPPQTPDLFIKPAQQAAQGRVSNAVELPKLAAKSPVSRLDLADQTVILTSQLQEIARELKKLNASK